MASSKRVPMGSKNPPTPKPPAEGKAKPSSVDTARRNRRLGGPAKKGAATPTGSGINDLVYRGPLKMSAKKQGATRTIGVKKQATRRIAKANSPLGKLPRVPKAPTKRATGRTKYGRGML
jgi:hypothetical protein